MAERSRARKDKKDYRNNLNGAANNFTPNHCNNNYNNNHHAGGLRYNPKKDSQNNNNNGIRPVTPNCKDNGKEPTSRSNIGSYYFSEGPPPPQFAGPVSYTPYYHPPAGYQTYDTAFEPSQGFVHAYGGVYSQNGICNFSISAFNLC